MMFRSVLPTNMLVEVLTNKLPTFTKNFNNLPTLHASGTEQGVEYDCCSCQDEMREERNKGRKRQREGKRSPVLRYFILPAAVGDLVLGLTKKQRAGD